MYSYEWDIKTGGLLLNSSPLPFSKEPRPVYYKELDILGFDKYWNYDKNDAYPYMWAEANNYWYRGKLVAKTKGGSLYSAPELLIVEEPEPENAPLRFVDVPGMVDKNKGLIEKLTQDTIKKVFNTYARFKDKVDVFYVAFSGGKDSIVTLDIVQRALPHNSFKVLFGDTGMEFPDTYDTVGIIEKECHHQGIEFIRAKSDLNPHCTWKQFGSPSKVTRWCCSVHKTSPQILALRNNLGKIDFTGMAFVGVRASESASRSEYDYISLGEKHKGQYSCNPILEWNAAELYLYVYSENLHLNEAYKKGNNRAGCLVCPNVSEKNAYFRRTCYPKEVDEYMNIIADLYKESIPTEEKMKEFLENTGWKARMNGRDVSIDIGCTELMSGDRYILKVRKPKNDWREWIKTIGVLLNESSPYRIDFRRNEYSFEVIELADGYEVVLDKYLAKTAPLFVKLLKNVFHKAACCIGCHECEADCQKGCITMINGKVKISENCVRCSQCHKVDRGCLIYKSLEMPKGGSKMETKSLNCYSTHAPKKEWINQYFSQKSEFVTNNSLGSQMFSFFKRFLRDAELIDGDNFSEFAKIIDYIGIDELESWGLILTNLVYSPQINWFVKNVKMNEKSSKEYITSMLVDSGTNERAANDIFRSFVRFVELPFAEVGMGFSEKEKNRVISVTRTPWQNPDPRVILYSLYKFAENCGDYYQFTLSRLLNHEIDSDGVSPTEIFGLDREQMEKILNGLSVNYPEFIAVSFTLDLDNITLRNDKASKDVLELF
jgi:3''-phosphoadenosine 5''-phosphosulfate sulfotransferase (PAPS reductase)/FAD synthetase and related enzymes